MTPVYHFRSTAIAQRMAATFGEVFKTAARPDASRLAAKGWPCRVCT